jgi:peptidoglycan/xylan/chitin deacetylase (PgdA/CDA1 family)
MTSTIFLAKTKMIIALLIIATLSLVACNRVPDAQRIYLTFDDGPDPKYTPALLNVLEKHNVKATFFVTGAQSEKYPEIVKQTYEAGHIIANHSYAHGNAEQMTYAQIEASYDRTDKIIRDITKQDIILFRAPFLRVSPDSRAYLCKHNRNSIGADWNGLDWETQDPQEIIDNLFIRKDFISEKGEVVVLLHDGGQGENGTRQGTVDATDEFITMMRARGVTFANTAPMHKMQISEADCQ